MSHADQTARIRQLNDEARCQNKSRTLVFTSGVAALDRPTQRRVILGLIRFDRFDAENDPYGEHDFGAFAVGGHRLFFKIDYYDRSGLHHSPDPADPALTCRVLTVMLAEEY